jgi:hypothetical protein
VCQEVNAARQPPSLTVIPANRLYISRYPKKSGVKPQLPMRKQDPCLTSTNSVMSTISLDMTPCSLVVFLFRRKKLLPSSG